MLSQKHLYSSSTIISDGNSFQLDSFALLVCPAGFEAARSPIQQSIEVIQFLLLGISRQSFLSAYQGS